MDILGAIDDVPSAAADLMLAAWKEFFALCVPPSECGDLPSITLLVDLATQRYLTLARVDRHKAQDWEVLERCFSPSEVARLDFWGQWANLTPGDLEQAAFIEERKTGADKRWRAAALRRMQEVSRRCIMPVFERTDSPRTQLKQGSLSQLRRKFDYGSFASEMVAYVSRVLDSDDSNTVGLVCCAASHRQTYSLMYICVPSSARSRQRRAAEPRQRCRTPPVTTWRWTLSSTSRRKMLARSRRAAAQAVEDPSRTRR